MKTPLVVTITIVGVLSTSLFAQRGGASRGGGAAIIGRGKLVNRNFEPFGPPGLRNFTNRNFNNNFNNGGFWGYPGFFGGYGFGDYGFYGPGFNDYAPPSAAAPAAMTPAPAPAFQMPMFPAPIPKPVVQVYHWQEAPAAESDAVFSIVTNDGVVHYASMAWVQGDRLHFNLPDGGTSQLPLTSISRKLTKAANAEKHLTLPLP
jgi:hypothetical protein